MAARLQLQTPSEHPACPVRHPPDFSSSTLTDFCSGRTHSFLTKVDLLKKKLESGVQFNRYVVSYGDRPNDVRSVITCEVFEGGYITPGFLANFHHDTVLKERFKTILQNSGNERSFYCNLVSAVVCHPFSKILDPLQLNLGLDAADRMRKRHIRW